MQHKRFFSALIKEAISCYVANDVLLEVERDCLEDAMRLHRHRGGSSTTLLNKVNLSGNKIGRRFFTSSRKS